MATEPQRIWDISPPIFTGMPVFPGDTPYQQSWSATLDGSCPVNVAQITLSPHAGAHADAPLHYDPQGCSVGELDLAPYLGPCRVVHCLGTTPLVEWAQLAHAVARQPLPPRVLVRTCVQMPQQRWDPQLRALAPELLERLADLGVCLIGIDSASIDPASSKTLDSHQVIRRRAMRVLENLLLDAVPEGDYELIALPLKLMQADASPVRAILRNLPTP